MTLKNKYECSIDICRDRIAESFLFFFFYKNEGLYDQFKHRGGKKRFNSKAMILFLEIIIFQKME